MENIIGEWVSRLILQAPELAVIGIVAWYLRLDLKECMTSNRDMLEKMLAELLDEKQE